MNPHTPPPWTVLAGTLVCPKGDEGSRIIAKCQHPNDAAALVHAVNEVAVLRRERDRLVALVEQYRNDLEFPPSPDSRLRRLDAIAAVVGRN
jgi:hypothetical protein